MFQLFDPKDSVRCAATSNVVLTGASSTQDGMLLKNNDRVLLPNQADKKQNGIYSVFINPKNPTVASFKRAADAKGQMSFTPGLMVYVEQGATYRNTGWVLLAPESGIFSVDKTNAIFDRFYPNRFVHEFTYADPVLPNIVEVVHNLHDVGYVYQVYNITGAKFDPDEAVASEDVLIMTFAPTPTPVAGRVVIVRG